MESSLQRNNSSPLHKMSPPAREQNTPHPNQPLCINYEEGILYVCIQLPRVIKLPSPVDTRGLLFSQSTSIQQERPPVFSQFPPWIQPTLLSLVRVNTSSIHYFLRSAPVSTLPFDTAQFTRTHTITTTHLLWLPPIPSPISISNTNLLGIHDDLCGVCQDGVIYR